MLQMCQRNFTGLGTVYMAETLFLRGVDPSRPVDFVSDLDALLIKRASRAGRGRNGSGSGARTASGRFR
jgi:endonuclease-8